MRRHLLLISLMICGAGSYAQPLARHAFIGIRMEAVTDDVARVMKLPNTDGVLISGVIPGSSAEIAGFQKGDVLLKLSDSIVHSMAQVFSILHGISEDQSVPYTINRGGKMLSDHFIARGLPYEKYEGADVIYGELQSGPATLRTITDKPKRQGKMPAVLFVQGIGCYSLDSPLDTDRAEIQLFRSLTRKGFVVVRVEKSGMGDSRGTPCDQLDFNTELAGYKQAYDMMKSYPYVDSSRCFIIGHSMGGVMAPLIAKEEPVKGIIAYGTIGVNFMQYWIDTRKTIADAYDMTPGDKDDYVKEQCQCAALLLDAHMKKEEALKVNPQCKDAINTLLLRDYPYWDQLTAVNIPGTWSKYAGKLLAMWGSADYISAKEEHKYIVDVINQSHPGSATFKEVKNASHGMQIASSFSEARTSPGGFNPAVANMMSEWLMQQMN